MNVTGTGTSAIGEPPVPVPGLRPRSEGQGNEGDLLPYVGSGVVTKAQRSSRKSLSPESKTQQAEQVGEKFLPQGQCTGCPGQTAGRLQLLTEETRYALEALVLGPRTCPAN